MIGGSLRGMARLQVYGQELNDESYAIYKADMLIKGQDADNVKCGNSFSNDGLPSIRADYLISNPPFGVDWTKAPWGPCNRGAGRRNRNSPTRERARTSLFASPQTSLGQVS